MFTFGIYTLEDTLPPGFAKLKWRQSFESPGGFTYYKNAKSYTEEDKKFKIEIRVLSYDIVEEGETESIFDQIQ